MKHRQLSAKVNIKTLVILVCVVVFLGVGAFTARHLRREILKRNALAAGQAALDQKDWETATKELRRYLERAPDDVEILQKYGEACLNVRPRSPETIGAAIGAYRRLLRKAPDVMETYDKLAELYSATRNMNELAYIATKCLEEQDANHLQAPLWLATSLVSQRKLTEARTGLEQFIARLETMKQNGELHEEYADACAILSAIAAQSDSSEDRKDAIVWLNRAVDYDPKSVGALLHRARFRRLQGQMDLAIQDLKAADALQPTDPRNLLALCGEWMSHGEYDDQAWAELRLMKNVGEDAIGERFSDLDDWRASLCLIEANLLLREGEATDRGALAEAIFRGDRRFEYDQHQIMVLPDVVKLYLADNSVADAEDALKRYVNLTALLPNNAANNEKIALLKAYIAQANDKPYEVIELLGQYLAQTPSDPMILKVLADAFRDTGQNRRASKALAKYLSGGDLQNDPEATLRLANERLRNGDFAEVLRLTSALEPLRLSAAILIRIDAQLRLAEKRGPSTMRAALDQVKPVLDGLHEQEPDRTAVFILQSVVAEHQGDLDAAERILKQAISDGKDPKLADTALADFYLRHAENEKAVQVCRGMCETRGDQADSWINLAKVYELDKQYDQARATLREGMETVANPVTQREIRFHLAIFELSHGQRQAGIDHALAIKDEDTHNLRARALLLDLPETLANAQAAQAIIEEIKKIQGEGGLLWRVHQAALWLADKDWKSKEDQIRTLLQACITADPGLPSAVILMGQLHTRLEQYDQAEQLYEQALAANPMAAGVADRLLALLQEQKRFEDARSVLERLHSRVANQSHKRLQVLLEAKDYHTVIDELKLKVARDPEDQNSRILLADLIYRATGDTAQALKYLDEADELETSINSAQARAGILFAEKRGPELRQLLDATVEQNKSFEAYYLRGGMLANLGLMEPAEADFIRLTNFDSEPRGFTILGSFYAANDRLDDAIEVLEHGLKLYPNNEDIEVSLMQALLDSPQSENRERGLDMLAALTARIEDDPRVLMVQALLALQTGSPEDLAKAEDYLTRIIDLNPTDVPAHMKLIDIALGRGDLETANSRALLALDSNREDPMLMLARAEIEYRLGNRSAAAMLVRNVITQTAEKTNTVNIRVKAVNILAGIALDTRIREDLDEAKLLLTSAIAETDVGGKDPNLRIIRALVLAALVDPTQWPPVAGEKVPEELAAAARENINQAMSSIDGILRIEPDFDKVQIELIKAQIFTDLKDTEKAGQHLAAAAVLAPNRPDVLYKLIKNYEAKEDFDSIVAIVAGDRTENQLQPELLLGAAASMIKSENPEHSAIASELLDKAMDRLPPTPHGYLDLAGLYYQAGRQERAAEVYQDVLNEYPDNPRALNDWAWILAKDRQQYDQALELARRGLANADATTQKTLRLNLLDTLGEILSDLTRYEEAKEAFMEYYVLTREDTPERAKSLLQLGRISAKLRDDSSTIRYLNNAMTIDNAHDVFDMEQREEISSLLEQTNDATVQ